MTAEGSRVIHGLKSQSLSRGPGKVWANAEGKAFPCVALWPLKSAQHPSERIWLLFGGMVSHDIFDSWDRTFGALNWRVVFAVLY